MLKCSQFYTLLSNATSELCVIFLMSLKQNFTEVVFWLSLINQCSYFEVGIFHLYVLWTLCFYDHTVQEETMIIDQTSLLVTRHTWFLVFSVVRLLYGCYHAKCSKKFILYNFIFIFIILVHSRFSFSILNHFFSPLTSSSDTLNALHVWKQFNIILWLCICNMIEASRHYYIVLISKTILTVFQG